MSEHAYEMTMEELGTPLEGSRMGFRADISVNRKAATTWSIACLN